jgi:hypothetical protein
LQLGRALRVIAHHRPPEAGLIEPFHGAVEVDFADADVRDVVAMRTIEFQRQLSMLAEALHVHLDAGGRLSARIRTGKEEACHSDLLRALKSKWTPAAKSQGHSDHDKNNAGACDRRAERAPASERIESAPRSTWVDVGVRPCSACRRDPHGLPVGSDGGCGGEETMIAAVALTVVQTTASAAPGTPTGLTALALAAVIAQHSPAVRAFDRRVIARLFRGNTGFGLTPNTKYQSTPIRWFVASATSTLRHATASSNSGRGNAR